MKRRTEKERRQRKTARKTALQGQKQQRTVNLGNLLEMLQEATGMNTQLVREISPALEGFDRRLTAIEEHLGIQKSDNQRGCATEEGARTNDGDGGGRVPVSGMQPTGEDLQEAAPRGDGVVSGEAGEEIPAGPEMVLNRGDTGGGQSPESGRD